MTLGRTLVRLLGLWLLASVLVTVYNWLYVVQFSMPPLIDAFIGTILILTLMRWTKLLPIWLTNARLAKLVSWAWFALTVLAGLLWAALSFMPEQSADQAVSQNLLLSLLNRLGTIAIQSISQLRTAFQARALALAVLTSLIYGLAALAAAVAGRIVWTTIQSSLGPRIDTLLVRFPRLRIRLGRWLAWSRRSLVAVLVLVSVLSVPAIVDNASTPQVTWYPMATGPKTGPAVQALVMGEQTGTLYAGTYGGGVFHSTDNGKSWQAMSVGLADSDVSAFVLDRQTGTLYVATWGGGVSRSTDGGTSWQAANTGLTNHNVLALMLDEQTKTLYAGTPAGVFRSTDGGMSWRVANTGLANPYVLALTLDEQTKTLYAGTTEGVFLSTDGGTSWRAANTGLTNLYVLALMLDEQTKTLYAGTDGGVFRSTDGGTSWRAANTGLTNRIVRALMLDEQTKTLYAGTDGGMFRLAEGETNWQGAGAGLTDSTVRALMQNEQTNPLYAVTDGGVFRSADGGANWQNVSTGLTNTNIFALAQGRQTNTLYIAGTDGQVFHYTDTAKSWQILTSTNVYTQANIFSTQDSYGVVYHSSGDDYVWATTGGGVFWARLAAGLSLRQATIRSRDGGRAEVLAAWGATIARAELPPGYRRVPLAWLALRAVGWKATLWVSANAAWLLVVLGLVGLAVLVSTYTNLVRPFRIPLWATVLVRRKLDVYAHPATLDTAWTYWEQIVRAELLRYGDATPDDLSLVPGPFRRYALTRYARTHETAQMLEARPGHVQLLTGDWLHRWQAAWTVAGRALGEQPGLATAGRAAIDQLAAAVAAALGLTLGPPRDFEAVRAYQVEAPALRLNIPPRFPLVFVADPQPGADTVQMLVDAVDVLKESGYFALVVPLEPPVRQLDIPAALRQAVDRSAHVQDFIVLGQDDVLNILIARHPAEPLVERVLAQVDLSVVSPFVVSGPVKETMFFGREAEVKTLVESSSSADFAIVGNRKIGKTSLLQRSLARMQAGRRVRPWMVDCQTVRDANGFFTAFQSQTSIQLSAATPEEFSAALTTLSKSGPPIVLMMDEVDALLAHEKSRGEPLAAAWRSLAQVGVCRFVFCGSTGLARQLDDPHSVFFNFPQELRLGYLLPETARLVLMQPLETLGIVLEDQEKLAAGVLDLTSGHPNLVQYLGRGLVEAANRRKERRILLADLENLRASNDFTEYYLKTIWGEAGALEKLITLVAPSGEFGLQELEATLAMQGVQVSDETLDAALNMLQIYSILDKRDRRYSFVPRAFPEILHRTQEVGRLVTFEKRRLTEGQAR